ncbi:MAG: hypothetical protein K2P65_15715 [Lachnospiraceae bacterium]|nr:hypothetical protein [Lachnospiraceae bacterium]
MKNKWEQDLFKMARQEKMIVPETLENRIDDILVSLPSQHRIFKMTWKKSLILAAAIIAAMSVTVSAAVGALKARMEAMNEKEMEEYFVQIYTSRVGMDNYNRPYTESEKARMKELRVSYEEEALFPEGLLKMLSAPEEYEGKGVAFYGATTTFFFPEKEMNDEELLRIIDFMYKRDYSLQAMNEKIEAGEIDFPSQTISEETETQVEATDDAVLQSEAVYDPAQELTIPYTGDLEICYMAMGQSCLFLTGLNEIHTMEIGSSDSTLFFDDFDSLTNVTALYQDKKGDVYIALMERIESGDYQHSVTMEGDKFKNSLWILSAEGEIKKKIDLSVYDEDIGGIIRRMVVDDEGYIYLRGTFMKELLMVLDGEGNFVKNIEAGLDSPYMPHPSAGLGIGKDGKVYTQVEAGTLEHMEMGIASVDFEKGTLGEIYMGIVPEETIMLDIIAKGADTDFVFWGYDGIFTYNLGEESAVNILPAYEAPCNWEGSEYCALPDGRIVFLDCSEYRQEEEGRFHRIPEKTCFYYMSGLREQ